MVRELVGREKSKKTHASRLVAKVLEHPAKSKKGKLITIKRTVVVCAIVAATPTGAPEIPDRVTVG